MTEPSLTKTGPPRRVFLGCAGWSIPKDYASEFAPLEKDGGGAHLERYARRLPAVEINSSFYRPHRPETYARWAASVPEHFRFSVKVPRQITHDQKLHAPEEPLARFLDEIAALGDKQGPLLAQLPPRLGFDEKIASAFFDAARTRFSGPVVCEPRHAAWFRPEADAVLHRFQIARVAADPATAASEAAHPGGWDGVAYYRLHGSPRIYYSPYSEEYLATLTQTLLTKTALGTDCVWCIFDNTALGAATANALSVINRLRSPKG